MYSRWCKRYLWPHKISPPKYGVLRLLKESEKQLWLETAHQRKYWFRSFVDLENIKLDVDEAKVACINFDVFQIIHIASYFMDHWFEWINFFVIDKTIVDCWDYFSVIVREWVPLTVWSWKTSSNTPMP